MDGEGRIVPGATIENNAGNNCRETRRTQWLEKYSLNISFLRVLGFGFLRRSTSCIHAVVCASVFHLLLIF